MPFHDVFLTLPSLHRDKRQWPNKSRNLFNYQCKCSWAN